MTQYDKLISDVLDGKRVSYKDAEKLLLRLHFKLSVSGSHHIFRKEGYHRSVSLKRRAELLTYQVKMLREVLKDHGYAK